MQNSFKKSFMFLMLLLALTFSAIGVTPALADDGVTPPADAPVVEQPVADTPVVDAPVATVQEPAVEEAAASTTEEPAAVEGSVADAPTVEESVAAPEHETVTVAEVLDQLPAETEVVVLDASGEPLSLASQDAATAIVSGDPMWCPRDSKPGSQGCTPGQSSLNDLINLFSTDAGATYSGAGTIYISWDYASDNPNATATDYGQNIVFSFGSLALTDLVVQGGWDFMNNWVTTSPSNLSGINSLNFLKKGDTTSLTINDIIIDGAGWNGYTLDGSAGLLVNGSYGSVALNNVSVTNSDQDGAQIYTNGDVTINDSDFSSNGHFQTYSYPDDYGYYGTGRGLDVDTNGNVTLDNVNASGNYSDGAGIYTNGSAVITNSQFDANGSTYSDSSSGRNSYMGSYFSHSEGGQGNGLDMWAEDGATLNNVSASENYGDGADIYTNGTVDITDSQFNSNGTTGFYEYSYEYYDSGSGSTDTGFGAYLSGNAYTLSNVTASNNVLDGVALSGRKSFSIINGGTSEATATFECSSFEDNGGYGVNSGFSGTLNLNNVTFNGNTAGDYYHEGTVNVGGGNCNPVTASDHTPAGKDNGEKKPLYIVIEQTQEQLPAALGEGFKFGSSLKVELTEEGKDVTDLAITLSFPIPADMKDANLAVMFWNGSAWVEVSGGSVANGFFVITVDQPGMYVLAAK
jgi:hypothetical protein